MFHFSNSEFINFELCRILSTAPYDGCDIAEFLEAAAQCTSKRSGGGGSFPDRWHSAWQTAGERAETVAREAEARGDSFSARKAYLRACNYFRASQYMMLPTNAATNDQVPRILAISERSVLNFERAMPLLHHDNICTVEKMTIPFQGERENVNLPGYLFTPPSHKRLSSGKKTPVLIVTCGADSSQEEHYFMYAAAAVQLGYAVVTFEGPGQGVVLRRQKLAFRPDWEVVVAAVLDELWAMMDARPDLRDLLDKDGVAIAGSSMGGYLALRGAADPRISACVSVDPFYSLWDFARVRVPPGPVTWWAAGWFPDSVLDRIVALVPYVSSDFQSRWEFEMSKWMFGTQRATDTFRRTMQFSFGPPPAAHAHAVGVDVDGGTENNFLRRVKCPVMVTGAGQSLYFRNLDESTNRIYREMVNVPDADKQVWVADRASEGGVQAKIGAFAMMHVKMFAFLDDKFGIQRDLKHVSSKL